MKRRKPCRLRHRWSKWAFVKVDYADGLEPEVREDLMFRMCRTCGHQEIKERACV